jgi:hypothetical protein
MSVESSHGSPEKRRDEAMSEKSGNGSRKAAAMKQ